MDVVRTIPAAWSPPYDCLASADLWEWWKPTTGAYILGGPVETESCYPPGYTGTSSEYYQATVCPTGFTSACNNADLTTCCPRAHSFVCNNDRGYAYLDATTFPCTSHWLTDSFTTTLTLTYTKLGESAQSVASYTVTRTSGIWAVTFTTSGSFTSTAVVSSPTTTPNTTSNTGVSQTSTSASTSPTSIQPGESRLSAEAAAGVGVGVAVGILILAAAAFFIHRRRRQRRQLPPAKARDPSDAGLLQPWELQDVQRKPDLPQPGEMAVNERPGELPT